METDTNSKRKSGDFQVHVLILGAGGAGLFCAAQAGKRGRKTLVLDHNPKVGSKILISGGGRCNFTNLNIRPECYVSENPHFCKSALSQYTSSDFISLVEKHKIAYHEKKLGQLFCDQSASQIVEMLLTEATQANVIIQLNTKIESLKKVPGTFGFECKTNHGVIHAESVVVATGGLSIPKIGATGLGYDIAKQFGIALVPVVPALDGFVLDEKLGTQSLSGVSLDVEVTCGGVTFRENILFTHKGLSGPAALQASLYWKAKNPVLIDLLPENDIFSWFLGQKREKNRSEIKNLLLNFFPKSFSEYFCELHLPPHATVLSLSPQALETFCKKLKNWELTPIQTVGYGKAEVTRGGVDTNELSSKTMESKKVPGLYFIGEVVDVTGWLGGYNFQWAWSSGFVAGQNA